MPSSICNRRVLFLTILFVALFSTKIKESQINDYQKSAPILWEERIFKKIPWTQRTLEKRLRLENEFFHELMKLRKNYVCRYSIATVEEAIHKQIQLIWKKEIYGPPLPIRINFLTRLLIAVVLKSQKKFCFPIAKTFLHEQIQTSFLF